MPAIEQLLRNNRAWAKRIEQEHPGFFAQLSSQQAPEYLWIGCADSRVPANDIIGLLPGEVFVHRNVANLVVNTDFNCLSCIQYAVEILQVKHIIVCGHYGCGGVRAAMQHSQLGLIDNWLRHIKDVYQKNQDELERIADDSKRLNRLVNNVCHTTIVQGAWSRGQELSVHSWIYDLHDGLLRDLKVCISSPDEIASLYQMPTTE
jgi:carbonic anhydrase